MKRLCILLFILLSFKTYSQEKKILGEAYFIDLPFKGQLFSDQGDSLEIVNGFFSFSINKSKISNKISIWFKNGFIDEGRFSIINIPIDKDSLFLGKFIIPPKLTLNETQMDSMRNYLTDSLKDNALVDKTINDCFYKQILVNTVDVVKQQYKRLEKKDSKIKFSEVEYKSKYIFSKSYIPCPLDLNKKIGIKYSKIDKTGFVDYYDILDCKTNKH